MRGIIYQITNTVQNRHYIGETKKSWQARWKKHRTMAAANPNGYLDGLLFNLADITVNILFEGDVADKHELLRMEKREIQERISAGLHLVNTHIFKDESQLVRCDICDIMVLPSSYVRHTQSATHLSNVPGYHWANDLAGSGDRLAFYEENEDDIDQLLFLLKKIKVAHKLAGHQIEAGRYPNKITGLIDYINLWDL